jgi:hypothetical protein
MPRRLASTLASALLILATATIPSPGVADSQPPAAADPAIERVLAKVFPALVRIDVVMVEGEDGRRVAVGHLRNRQQHEHGAAGVTTGSMMLLTLIRS